MHGRMQSYEWSQKLKAPKRLCPGILILADAQHGSGRSRDAAGEIPGFPIVAMSSCFLPVSVYTCSVMLCNSELLEASMGSIVAQGLCWDKDTLVDPVPDMAVNKKNIPEKSGANESVPEKSSADKSVPEKSSANESVPEKSSPQKLPQVSPCKSDGYAVVDVDALAEAIPLCCYVFPIHSCYRGLCPLVCSWQAEDELDDAELSKALCRVGVRSFLFCLMFSGPLVGFCYGHVPRSHGFAD